MLLFNNIFFYIFFVFFSFLLSREDVNVILLKDEKELASPTKKDIQSVGIFVEPVSGLSVEKSSISVNNSSPRGIKQSKSRRTGKNIVHRSVQKDKKKYRKNMTKKKMSNLFFKMSPQRKASFIRMLKENAKKRGLSWKDVLNRYFKDDVMNTINSNVHSHSQLSFMNDTEKKNAVIRPDLEEVKSSSVDDGKLSSNMRSFEQGSGEKAKKEGSVESENEKLTSDSDSSAVFKNSVIKNENVNDSNIFQNGTEKNHKNWLYKKKLGGNGLNGGEIQNNDKKKYLAGNFRDITNKKIKQARKKRRHNGDGGEGKQVSDVVVAPYNSFELQNNLVDNKGQDAITKNSGGGHNVELLRLATKGESKNMLNRGQQIIDLLLHKKNEKDESDKMIMEKVNTLSAVLQHGKAMEDIPSDLWHRFALSFHPDKNQGPDALLHRDMFQSVTNYRDAHKNLKNHLQGDSRKENYVGSGRYITEKKIKKLFRQHRNKLKKKFDMPSKNDIVNTESNVISSEQKITLMVKKEDEVIKEIQNISEKIVLFLKDFHGADFDKKKVVLKEILSIISLKKDVPVKLYRAFSLLFHPDKNKKLETPLYREIFISVNNYRYVHRELQELLSVQKGEKRRKALAIGADVDIDGQNKNSMITNAINQDKKDDVKGLPFDYIKQEGAGQEKSDLISQLKKKNSEGVVYGRLENHQSVEHDVIANNEGVFSEKKNEGGEKLLEMIKGSNIEESKRKASIAWINKLSGEDASSLAEQIAVFKNYNWLLESLHEFNILQLKSLPDIVLQKLDDTSSQQYLNIVPAWILNKFKDNVFPVEKLVAVLKKYGKEKLIILFSSDEKFLNDFFTKLSVQNIGNLSALSASQLTLFLQHMPNNIDKLNDNVNLAVLNYFDDNVIKLFLSTVSIDNYGQMMKMLQKINVGGDENSQTLSEEEVIKKLIASFPKTLSAWVERVLDEKNSVSSIFFDMQSMIQFLLTLSDEKRAALGKFSIDQVKDVNESILKYIAEKDCSVARIDAISLFPPLWLSDMDIDMVKKLSVLTEADILYLKEIFTKKEDLEKFYSNIKNVSDDDLKKLMSNIVEKKWSQELFEKLFLGDIIQNNDTKWLSLSSLSVDQVTSLIDNLTNENFSNVLSHFDSEQLKVISSFDKEHIEILDDTLLSLFQQRLTSDQIKNFSLFSIDEINDQKQNTYDQILWNMENFSSEIIQYLKSLNTQQKEIIDVAISNKDGTWNANKINTKEKIDTILKQQEEKKEEMTDQISRMVNEGNSRVFFSKPIMSYFSLYQGLPTINGNDSFYVDKYSEF